tara:strand:- start:13239 stop:13616 length:378 start_codon:yes stop_codon:yes gene_type:complete
MKRVKFVRQLVVDDVRYVGDYVEYRCIGTSPDITRVVKGDEEGFLLGVEQKELAPVHHLCDVHNGTRRDLFIAYSKEVQELLGMPFDTLSNELEDAREAISALHSRIGHATLWQRIKYLFTKRLR